MSSSERQEGEGLSSSSLLVSSWTTHSTRVTHSSVCVCVCVNKCKNTLTHLLYELKCLAKNLAPLVADSD